MKINKFKKISKDKYKLFLETGDVITLYEDVIINNNLLLSKKLDDNLLEKLTMQNNEIHIYDMALNFLSIRMRSKKEVYNYLLKKEIPESLIKMTIDRLVKNGFLNDYNFAKAYVNDQLILSNNGPYKIKNNLIELGIKDEIVIDVLKSINIEHVKEKLGKLIDKKLKSSKGSFNMIKIKLLNYFYNLGYDKKDILQILDNVHKETDILYLQKEYNKLHTKYSKKYSGAELKYFIEQKLYSKGYAKEDVGKIKREI